MARLLGARLDGKDERSRRFVAPMAHEIHSVLHHAVVMLVSGFGS